MRTACPHRTRSRVRGMVPEGAGGAQGREERARAFLQGGEGSHGRDAGQSSGDAPRGCPDTRRARSVSVTGPGGSSRRSLRRRVWGQVGLTRTVLCPLQDVRGRGCVSLGLSRAAAFPVGVAARPCRGRWVRGDERPASPAWPRETQERWSRVQPQAQGHRDGAACPCSRLALREEGERVPLRFAP